MLHIVIAVFNGWEQTSQCLNCLAASVYQEFKVVVIDHGSTDETTKLASTFPEVIYQQEGSHLWWAGATNKGIELALSNGADRVMLLNNDCYVTPHTIGALISHCEILDNDPYDYVIAPAQYALGSDKSNSENIGSFMLGGFTTLIIPSYIRKPEEIGNGALIATGMIVGGRGVIVSKTVLLSTKSLDARTFPHYSADHDFFFRCQVLGIRLITARDAKVSIDNTRSSSAASIQGMSLRTFQDSFTSIRSHRNWKAIQPLFKRHYPIKYFHTLGITFFYLRYLIVFTALKLKSLLHRSNNKP